MNIPLASVVSVCLLLGSCSYAKELWTEPEPEDLMGESLYLEEAGTNVEIDLGPGAETLLTQYQTVKEENIKLRQSLAALQAEREGLQASLEEARNEVSAERSLRAQADAESGALRKSRREMEAVILSLSIARARLEQENLLLHIDRVEKNLAELKAAPPVEAAAPPRIRR